MQVSSGQVSSGCDISGEMIIYDGGIASDTTVLRYGQMTISSGGVARRTNVTRGGTMLISSGGVASNTSVYGSQWNSNGESVSAISDLIIRDGGIAIGAGVARYGRITISSGGVASAAIVDEGGAMRISSGGMANRTTVDYLGSMYISSGGVACDTTVNTWGSMYISSGGVANHTTVSSGGWMYISSGGTADYTTISAGAFVSISSGGTATNLIWTPGFGTLNVEDGAIISYASQLSGVYYGKNSAVVMENVEAHANLGPMYIMSGGTANNIRVSYKVYIMSGGVANDTHLLGGSMFVSNGGVAYATSGVGELYIYSGGSAVDTIRIGDSMYVSNGGSAIRTVVSTNAARLTVFSGGLAESTSIRGGYMYVSSGGVASNTENKGGGMSILDGGVAYNTIIKAGKMSILDGGVASDTTVMNSGMMYISIGGVASDTTVSSGGCMFISSGGRANRITVHTVGSMYISSGGVASDTTISSGGKMILRNGDASDTTVSSGGYMFISIGGVASDTTVSSGGCMYISGGGASDTTVSSGGCMFISSGGRANSVTVNSAGRVQIDQGGSASRLILHAGGELGGFSFAEDRVFDEIVNGVAGFAENVFICGNKMHISSGGVANRITVHADGMMYISSGGTASIVFNPWRGVITSAAGATVEYLERDASIYFGSTGKYISKTITELTNHVITSGNSVIIYDRGVANHTTVSSGGNMCISSGGVANSTAMNGGKMYIKGSANNTTVDSGGSMIVSSGGIHRGSLQLNAGAVVSAYEGSTIDFTLNDRTVEDGYLINDLSLIKGSPTYTITVSADQAAGTYKLAQGASAFTGSITIGTETENYGTLTVNGEALNHQDAIYSLVKDEGNLLLKIDHPVVFIYSSGTLTSAGMEVSGVILNASNSMHITSGGTAFNTEVKSKGAMYISRGGIAVDTILSGGTMLNGGVIPIPGEMHVYDGGVANNTVVSAYASAHISSGGMLNNTTVYDNGCLFVCSSGIAQKTEINWGWVSISSGGIATDTAVNCGGAMRISSGGVASDTTLDAASYLYVLDGGIASNTVNGGFIHISSGGTANSTTVNPKGKVYISSGGTATEVKENGGFVDIEDGAEVTFVSNTFSGARLSAALAATVHSGTTALDTVITDSATMFIFSGGVANGTTMESSATMRIFSGGITNNTIVSGYSATIYISSGGVANSTAMNGGKMYIKGSANNTTVNSGGSMIVSSGGIHRGGLQLKTGAVVSAYEGSTIDFTLTDRTPEHGYLINNLAGISGTPTYTITVSADQAAGTYKLALGAESFTGSMTIKTETEIYGTLTVNGDVLKVGDVSYELLNYGSDNLVLNIHNHNMIVSSGSVVSGTQIFDGKLTIPDGAVTSDTTINSGGSMLVSGGVASNTTVSSGGSMTIFEDGVASTTEVKSGGSMLVSGGVASDTTVSSGGNMTIFEGGVASDTTVTSGGSMFISSGGTAKNVNWKPCEGYVFAQDGAVVTYVEKYSGVYYGANHKQEAHVTELNDFYYSGSIYVMSGGTVNQTSMGYGGRMYVHDGGIANDLAFYSACRLNVFSGGQVNRAQMFDGEIHIYSGGVAEETLVFYNNVRGASSYLKISGGGIANDTMIRGGIAVVNGIANHTTVSSGGRINISSYGVASDTTVSSGGAMTIFEGGMASDTTVNSRGKMYLSSGSVHQGGLQIASGAVVSAYEGSTIDFTLTNRTPEDDYLINDLSLIQGAPDYTITVSVDQMAGIYKLAQEVGLFIGPITIGTETETYGTLTVGGSSLIHNYKEYILIREDSQLLCSITNLDIAGPVLEITGNATAWTNKNVVLTADASDSPSGLASIEYSLDNINWTEGESVSVSRNGTVYFRATDNAGNITTQSVVVNRIDKDAPAVGRLTVKQQDQNKVLLTASGFTDNNKIARYDFYLAGKKIGSSTNGIFTYNSTSNLTGTLNFSVKTADIVENISAAASSALPITVTVVGRATEKTTSIRWAAASMSGGVKQYEIRISGMSKTFKSKTNSVTLKKLTAGNHTVTIYAINKAKQRVLVASGAPLYVNDITAPKGGKVKLSQRNQNSVLVSISGFTDNVKVARYDIYLNGRKVGSTTSNSYVYNGTNLAGSLKFSVRAFDAAGNAAKDKNATIKIKDATAPDRVVGLRVVGKANEKVTTLSWNRAGDNVGVTQYEIRVSGSSKVYKSKTTSITIKKLSAGAHTFTVTAIDKAKNRSVVSQSVKFTVLDGTAPKGGKVSLSQLNANSVRVSISGFTDNVKVARYDIYLNGAKVGSTSTNSFTYKGGSALSGSLKFSVMAVDAAGNVSKAKNATLKIKAAPAARSMPEGPLDLEIGGIASNSFARLPDERNSAAPGAALKGFISGTAGADVVEFAADLSRYLDGMSLGAGNDTVILEQSGTPSVVDVDPLSGYGLMDLGAGNDLVRLEANTELESALDLGLGNDTLIIEKGATLDLDIAGLDFGAGSDKLVLNGTLEVDCGLISGLETVVGNGEVIISGSGSVDDSLKSKFKNAGIKVTTIA